MFDIHTSSEKCFSWFSFWECVPGLPQYEATKAYMPKEPDELSLRQAELVIVLQKEEGEAQVFISTTELLLSTTRWILLNMK